MLKRSAVLIIAVVAAACSTPGPAPETPKLVSIAGHGTPTISNNIGAFQFAKAAFDPTTRVVTFHTGSTVVFTVPYPTSIEAFINGKPLTKVDPPNSDRYEYSGAIVNPGDNPAKWSMGVRTPFDVPFTAPNYQTGYTLTIVDVSGSQRSAPLTIHYYNPAPFVPPFIITGITYTTDSQTGSTTFAGPGGGTNATTGNCPGGGQEKTYTFCFRTSDSTTKPYSAGTKTCTEAQALAMLTNQFPAPQFSATSGACPLP